MEQPISYELLNKIDSPEDLRHLPIESLPEVCRELRDKIIDELSRNPAFWFKFRSNRINCCTSLYIQYPL